MQACSHGGHPLIRQSPHLAAHSWPHGSSLPQVVKQDSSCPLSAQSAHFLPHEWPQGREWIHLFSHLQWSPKWPQWSAHLWPQGRVASQGWEQERVALSLSLHFAFCSWPQGSVTSSSIIQRMCPFVAQFPQRPLQLWVQGRFSGQGARQTGCGLSWWHSEVQLCLHGNLTSQRAKHRAWSRSLHTPL